LHISISGLPDFNGNSDLFGGLNVTQVTKYSFYCRFYAHLLLYKPPG